MSLVLLLSLAAAPVPKDDPKLAPPPRPVVRMHALLFDGDTVRPFNRTVRYGLFDGRGPTATGFVPVPEPVRHVALDPTSKTLYGINSNDMFVVRLGTTGREDLESIPVHPTLKREGWMCGIAFDTRRNRVVVVGLAGKGGMCALDVKTGTWAELGDMNNLDLAALTYSPKDDALYGLYQSHRGGKPAIGAFDPVTGKPKAELILDAAEVPRALGQVRGGETTAQLASVGGHLLILTDARLFRLNLASKEVTVEWSK